MKLILNKMWSLVRFIFTVFVGGFQFYLVGVYLFAVCFSLQLNDECIASRTGENGICKLINDCPRIVLEIREQSKYPTICGFQRAQQIICCPNVIVPNRIDTQQNSKFNRISAESAYAKNLFISILNS